MNKQTKEKLKKLKQGDVIQYETEYGPNYLIIKSNENEKISGQIAIPIGVNCISIENLLKEKNLEIAKWDKI